MAGRSPDDGDRGSAFLQRWSRRKHEAARGEAPTPPPVPGVPVEASAASPAVPAPAVAPGESALPAEPPPLPPVESLTIDSDFTPFLAKKVDETVKRAALRKLFSDPHFNVMDGLDIYIGDYSKPDPMPPGFLDKLADVYKSIEEKVAHAPNEAGEGEVSADTTIATAAAEPPPSREPAQDPPSSAPASSSPSDEHRG